MTQGIRHSPKNWGEVDVPQLEKTIREQRVEIARLRALLARWDAQNKYLFDCFDDKKHWRSEALIRLTEATTKALK